MLSIKQPAIDKKGDPWNNKWASLIQMSASIDQRANLVRKTVSLPWRQQQSGSNLFFPFFQLSFLFHFLFIMVDTRKTFQKSYGAYSIKHLQPPAKQPSLMLLLRNQIFPTSLSLSLRLNSKLELILLKLLRRASWEPNVGYRIISRSLKRLKSIAHEWQPIPHYAILLIPSPDSHLHLFLNNVESCKWLMNPSFLSCPRSPLIDIITISDGASSKLNK